MAMLGWCGEDSLVSPGPYQGPAGVIMSSQISSQVETVIFANLGAPRQSYSCGQIIRGREISSFIKSHHAVSKHTTINYGAGKLPAALKLIGELGRNKEIFVLPGRRTLIYLGTILALLRFFKLCKARTHLVAIGGWLPVIVRKPSGRIALLGFNSVSAQLPSMLTGMSRPRNRFWLPNFRAFDTSKIRPKVSSDVLRLVHISRLRRDKGVFESIETALLLKKRGVRARLTIYGPDEFSSEEDRTEFANTLDRSGDLITYGGDLPREKVIPTMALFDFLLFPSRYPGEGFPGVIVEAMIARIPVVALDFGFVSEIALHYQFGFVVTGEFASGALKAILGNRGQHATPGPVGADSSNISEASKWFDQLLRSSG